jgi:hypothetical protein
MTKPRIAIAVGNGLAMSFGHPPCVRLVVTLIKSSFIEQRAREE